MTQDMKVKLAEELSDDVLIHVHPSRYVETINRSEPTISTVRLDPDTYMSPGSLRAAKLAAGACVAAVSDILQEKTDRAFCAIRPPGHHAGPMGCVPSTNYWSHPQMASSGFCLSASSFGLLSFFEPELLDCLFAEFFSIFNSLR